jgi:hypothetical protein
MTETEVVATSHALLLSFAHQLTRYFSAHRVGREVRECDFVRISNNTCTIYDKF